MNQLTKVFEKQVLTIIEADGDSHFLLNDVCKVLDLSPRVVRQRLDEDVCSTYPLQTAGGRQRATFVNEDGLYDVILDSRKPEAKRFRKWITSEVLPSIRKHGTYMTAEVIEQVLTDPDTLIKLATNLKEERSLRVAAETQIQEEKKYTDFGKVVSLSDGAINVGAFAKVMYDEHGVNIGRNKLMAWLRNKGFLIVQGREKNFPKQQYVERGWFKLSTTVIKRSHGDVQGGTTLITGKGQVELAKILLSEFKAIAE